MQHVITMNQDSVKLTLFLDLTSMIRVPVVNTFNGWVRIPIDPDVSFTVTGVMVEKPKLTWTMECEDGSVPPAAIGWVTVGDDDNSLPAQNYYTAATPYNQ